MAGALSWLGFSAFVLTLPHHYARNASPVRQVANDFLNADLGASIRSIRQSVCDVRSLVTWLRAEGFAEVHLIGVSLGSCVASLVAAFDARLASTSLFLTAGDFAETVWNGRATQHIRAALDPHIDLPNSRGSGPSSAPRHSSTIFARTMQGCSWSTGGVTRSYPSIRPSAFRRRAEKVGRERPMARAALRSLYARERSI